MKKLISKFNPFGHKVFRKGFWLFGKHTKHMEVEAKKNWGNNQSALLRHILDCWFDK